MKHIVIIGAGPRGLAVALRASLYNYKVTIVDDAPMSTWTFPYMLPDMQMRSPITFDLVTYCPDLKDYSLTSFLNYKVKADSQEEIEACTTYCRRQDFINYLTYIIKILKQRGVVFAKHNACTITKTEVQCGNLSIPYDYLVVAAGRKVQEAKRPVYLNDAKLISIADLPERQWKSKGINVVGSGQQAAEIVNYLCEQKADVTWLQKHKPKVSQYPVPSYSEWGVRSALSNYYTVCPNKLSYLTRVKAWAPSITPYIAERLKTCRYKVLDNPQSTKDINTDYEFILAAGSNNEVELLNFDFNIDKNLLNPKLPRLTNNFQSTNNPNIFFTGLLAVMCNGPRQGSIISSGDTAKTILDSINSL